MNLAMKKMHKLTAAFLACLMLGSGVALTSCSDDDDEFSTNQYVGGVSLNVYGPSPVARGGELRFLGSGLDQIQSVTIPGCSDITEIKVISPNEIRVTVPQTAEVGKVVLHHAKGDITTKTNLTYTEPIGIESISPLTIKPGQTLTINGEYLNLIHEVIFAEDVTVTDADFTAHSRKEIKLVVPAEAQTGKIIISDGAEMPNLIYSDDVVNVVLPSTTVQDLTGAKPGQTVTVKGADLELVEAVEMPNGDQVEFTVNEAGTELKFTLPSNVSDGAIVMIPASGVKVAVATIGIALPAVEEIVPAVNLWAGDVVTFKGKNMEVVTEVKFNGAEAAVAPESVSSTEVSVKVPAGTQSGAVQLIVGSGAYTECEIQTLKPENVSYNPAPAALAGKLTVNGSNLQNVKAITIGGTEIAVDGPAADSFSITVPATLNAGENTVEFTMTNGEKVAAPAIELSAPECAYASELPGEDVEIHGGETAILKIKNEKHLTGVKVNGQPVQYILNGQTLIVQIPQTCGAVGKVTLVSDNGEITYELAVIPATHVGLTVWEGLTDITWGDGGRVMIPASAFQDAPAGSVLTFHYAQKDQVWAQAQVNYGDWTGINFDQAGDGMTTFNQTLVPTDVYGWEFASRQTSMILTSEILANIQSKQGECEGVPGCGIIIQGSDLVFSKVTLEWEVSLETTIWEKEWTCLGWDGNQDLAWGGYDWSSVKAGQKLRFYLTSTKAEGEWFCISLRHGDGWGNLPDPIPGQYDSPSSPLEVELTQNVIDDLVNSNGLVITGQDYTLTKITIE